MSIRIALHHVTKYKYERPISLGPQIVRLKPAPHSRTPILSYSLKITPAEHFINWQQDPQGNYLARLVFPNKTDVFEVAVDLIADMTVINSFDFFLTEEAMEFPFEYEVGLKSELKPYLEKQEYGEKFMLYLSTFGQTKKPTMDALVELIQQLNKDIRYLIRMEPGVQTPDETLEKKSGSCRDSAWLLVNLLRHKGLAARFVSGYLVQLQADVKSLDGPSGAENDFTDLHAWAEVYLPGAGWVGLDATSGLLTGEGHIPLVATPEPSSAAPISGLLEASKTEFSHEMSVSRCYEDPRVTKPYTEAQWQKIQLIGEKVDQALFQNDVKLTMGGEPTFVNTENVAAPEWNTEALGKEKFLLSEKLFRKLKVRWTKGALIYSGQGKWYPGEQLPRWVLGCYWRKDGKAIWRNEKLLADESVQGNYTTALAKRFIETLAMSLGVDQNNILPGYEDSWYYMWKENRLPINVDTKDSKLKDELERNRIAKVFEQGLGEIVGYTLPLTSKDIKSAVVWVSSPWVFSSKNMHLIQGDSPMGLRMPLDSIPWAKKEDIKQIVERDPQIPLDAFDENVNALYKQIEILKNQIEKLTISKGSSAKEIVRTALCVEQRHGRMYIFLPPLETMEVYLDLIKHIEHTAETLNISVVIEGYAPPFDPRVEVFKITPDPGVIEVNVAPVSNWRDLVNQTTSLYEEAHLTRLGTEKFMLDGKHTGTGGGNHIVLGGLTPSESPFLRRPDLLASIVSYWNNHPSLSYLFSGQFIGPTSQAPRVDEGRKDSIYELELAVKQVDEEIRKFGQCPPWIVDRLFRHLLVDGTGNTHRTEICIDKLYSPDSTTGRLGLVEFRGFEMPPHAQMSIAQQLLIRALVMRFWNKPYKEKLIRWNTSLHDRFLLPHFVKQDFQEVLLDLNQAGFELSMDYFVPHFEFRFPKIGAVDYNNIHLEIRTAIEPWYVLGEEPAGGGTSRYVDSSLEKVQIKINGRFGDRYMICCNGRQVPLHSTEIEGEYVAGIRYRAWQPPSCLHPTIGVHAPLNFDVIDTWNMRSIGGCVYFVSHPGGRLEEAFPINAYAAESRRVARFFKIGHTPGKWSVLPGYEISSDYPLTLDLRT
jgi:uncharacterized protein (DUF2126 family)